MRNIVFPMVVAASILAFIPAACERSEKTGTDRLMHSRNVVATVDGVPIYEGKVYRRIQAAYGEIRRETVEPTRWQMMHEAGIESEIIEHLMLRAARAENLSVAPETIDRAMGRTKETMGEEGFRKMLKERKATEKEFRAFLEEREMIDRYKEELFASVAVGDDDVRRYYDGHRDDFTEPETVKLDVFTAKDREQADELYRRWKKGETFEKLAEEYGSRTGEKVGRRLRWMPYDAIPGALRLNVREGVKGEIIGPVSADGTFYVVKVLDRRPARRPDFEEAKEEVRNTVRLKRQQEVLDRWYEEQLRKVTVEYIR